MDGLPTQCLAAEASHGYPSRSGPMPTRPRLPTHRCAVLAVPDQRKAARALAAYATQRAAYPGCRPAARRTFAPRTAGSLAIPRLPLTGPPAL